MLSTCWEGTPVTSLIGFLVFLHWAKRLFRRCSLQPRASLQAASYSSCGVPGRFIGENVVFLRDVVHYASSSGATRKTK